MAKRNQETAQLDSRLSDYSAVARTSAAANKMHGRLGNWPIYAAAAGSALAMTTSASAGIITGVYNPASNTVQPLGPGGLGSESLKEGFLGIGSDHIIIKASSTAGGPGAALSVIGISPVGIFETTVGGVAGNDARKFAFGAQISTGPYAATGKIVKANFTGQTFGKFSAGVSGYAGLVINVGGQLDYGWLKLVFTNNADTGLPSNLTAIAYGIELDGSAIEAGETPEPGTMDLALLASGAAGVVALRRRRALSQI